MFVLRTSFENSDPSVYYAPKLTGSEAFQAPQKIMRDIWLWNDPTEERAEELKKMGAHELTDGGGTDSHGIATAVETGATDVFVVDVVSDLMSWKTHFSGAIERLANETAIAEGLEPELSGSNRIFQPASDFFKPGRDLAADAVGDVIDAIIMDDVSDWDIGMGCFVHACKDE
jgi:hypothetical protein